MQPRSTRSARSDSKTRKTTSLSGKQSDPRRPTLRSQCTTSSRTIAPSSTGRSRSSMPARRSSWRSRVQTPVEDMAAMGKPRRAAERAGLTGAGGAIDLELDPSALVELIRSHRSTLLFVNSRRLAERLAGALNEIAGEPLVRAHHGSLARAQRTEIEDLLKGGHLRALVATSSLELGIDMGAIDLVIQIEAPPSVASGLQRIGRAGHSVDQVSEGIIFPKFRGDLVACAAVTAAMRQGKVESSRYPRNPLDVLAQQLVAMTVDGTLVGRRSLSHRSVRGAVCRAEPADLRRRARHAVGPLPVRRVRRAAAARDLGSRQRHGDGAAGRQARGHRQRRHHSRSRPLRRVPRRAPTRTRRASASSTRRWCSRRAPAKRSCSAPRRGASIRSRTIACWSRRRRASPARCRSGKVKARAGPSSWAWRSASWCASCASRSRRTRSPRSRRITASMPSPAATCCSISTINTPPPAPCPTIAPSSSSGRATTSATGASRC